MKKKARYVRHWTTPNGGVMMLIHVTPHLVFQDSQSNQRSTHYLIVSAVDVPHSGPETFIFPANRSGDVISWLELSGSYRGGLSHIKAIEDAGYESITFPVLQS